MLLLFRSTRSSSLRLPSTACEPLTQKHAGTSLADVVRSGTSETKRKQQDTLRSSSSSVGDQPHLRAFAVACTSDSWSSIRSSGLLGAGGVWAGTISLIATSQIASFTCKLSDEPQLKGSSTLGQSLLVERCQYCLL